MDHKCSVISMKRAGSSALEKMMTEVEKENEKMKRSFEIVSKKVMDCRLEYSYQTFNSDESDFEDMPFRRATYSGLSKAAFLKECNNRKADFSIEPVSFGKVKVFSFSDLGNIIDFSKDSLMYMWKTPFGRLFKGILTEGQSVIVKTWDHLLPINMAYWHNPDRFLGEIEFLLNGKLNKHPNLMELSAFCFERRLAAVYVYDNRFSSFLWDKLPCDDFGLDMRISVAIQLAELLEFLHDNGIAVGSFTTSSIMIDKELKIKMFDFGMVTSNLKEDCEIDDGSPIWVRDAPEVINKGKRCMKSDVYVFGALLLDLIAKEERDMRVFGPKTLKGYIEAKTIGLFGEEEAAAAHRISGLVRSCIEHGHPKNRPTMKSVLSVLRSTMDMIMKKRKRDEDPVFGNSKKDSHRVAAFTL